MPAGLNKITLGLGWSTRLDLDSSVLMLDKNGDEVDRVFFGSLRSKDGGIIHAGDNTTGEGAGDDETI